MADEQAYQDALQRLPPEASMALEIAVVAINGHHDLKMASTVLRATADAIDESVEGS